jgi:hypothetical protein
MLEYQLTGNVPAAIQELVVQKRTDNNLSILYSSRYPPYIKRARLLLAVDPFHTEQRFKEEIRWQTRIRVAVAPAAAEVVPVVAAAKAAAVNPAVVLAAVAARAVVEAKAAAALAVVVSPAADAKREWQNPAPLN